ncbi:MAG: hypothetical protein KIT79_02180 [Deltaproteobacteria bacterium]|nr:hypothetical protein [Deltaproteobacteria bacterium]
MTWKLSEEARALLPLAINLNPLETYDENETYYRADGVRGTWDGRGALFLSRTNGNVGNPLPVAPAEYTEHWLLLSVDGAPGEVGADGEDGEDGADGEGGADPRLFASRSPQEPLSLETTPVELPGVWDIAESEGNYTITPGEGASLADLEQMLVVFNSDDDTDADWLVVLGVGDESAMALGNLGGASVPGDPTTGTGKKLSAWPIGGTLRKIAIDMLTPLQNVFESLVTDAEGDPMLVIANQPWLATVFASAGGFPSDLDGSGMHGYAFRPGQTEPVGRISGTDSEGFPVVVPFGGGTQAYSYEDSGAAMLSHEAAAPVAYLFGLGASEEEAGEYEVLFSAHETAPEAAAGGLTYTVATIDDLMTATEHKTVSGLAVDGEPATNVFTAAGVMVAAGDVLAVMCEKTDDEAWIVRRRNLMIVKKGPYVAPPPEEP